MYSVNGTAQIRWQFFHSVKTLLNGQHVSGTTLNSGNPKILTLPQNTLGKETTQGTHLINLNIMSKICS